MRSSRWLFSYIIMQQCRKGEPDLAQPGPFSPCVTRCHHMDPLIYIVRAPRRNPQAGAPPLRLLYIKYTAVISLCLLRNGITMTICGAHETRQRKPRNFAFSFNASLVPPSIDIPNVKTTLKGRFFCDRNIIDTVAHFLFCNLQM